MWALAPEASAQETIASDRPGIGSGAFVLQSGTIQIETGLEYASFGAGSSKDVTYSFGQALVRIGTSALELQIFANSLVITDRKDNSVGPEDWGFEDPGFGVKLPLVLDGGGGLALSLQGIVTAPLGSEGFTNHEWGPALNGLADVALGRQASVSVNLGHQRDFDFRGGATSVIVTPAFSLGSGVGVYGGWAGEFFTDRDAVHVAEVGLTFLPSDDTQLDLNGGWDTAENRNSWFIGVGLATRRGGS